jgi:hypothetical protein
VSPLGADRRLSATTDGLVRVGEGGPHYPPELLVSEAAQVFGEFDYLGRFGLFNELGDGAFQENLSGPQVAL